MKIIFAFLIIISLNSFACDDKQKVETKRVDSFGNYTIKDNKGNTIYCRKDSFGNVTCKK